MFSAGIFSGGANWKVPRGARGRAVEFLTRSGCCAALRPESKGVKRSCSSLWQLSAKRVAVPPKQRDVRGSASRSTAIQRYATSVLRMLGHRFLSSSPVTFRFLLLAFVQVSFTESWYVTSDSLVRLRAKRDITFPGTKWCGPGSRAANYTDLGDEHEVDKCCRSHDHCPESIPGYRWKHGLHNPTPYTRSHCYCDDSFRRCLENAKSKIGNLVAEIYFNFLKIKCYKEDCPIIRCLKFTGARPQRVCQEYKMDCNKPRIWQFFDPRKFDVS